MPTTMLDQATAMIENAWGQPIEALESSGSVAPATTRSCAAPCTPERPWPSRTTR